jgi:hypothetical protein
MRHLSLIAVLAVALLVSAASGTIVWADFAPASDSIIWGN